MFYRSVIRRFLPFSPISGKEPQFVHNALSKSRKGKDIFDGAHHLLNSTGLYQNILKHNGRYWTFVITSSIIGTWYWCRMWDRIWIKINKGKLAYDTPYVMPPSDDDDDEDED